MDICNKRLCGENFLMEKTFLRFHEKKLRKANQTTKFRIEILIKKKDNKLYVKWNGYDNSFNSWVDKKTK